MADHGNSRIPVRHSALILAGLVVLHYGWNLAPVEHQAQVWNIAGAAARLAMLGALLWTCRGLPLAIGAWWAAEELMVIGCSGLYIVRPWAVPLGEAQCSALIGYDLGTLGVVVITILAFWLPARSDR